MANRPRDFTKMNPPIFVGSKVDEDPYDFLDEVYKILFYIGVSTTENAKLATYQLKDVALIWYNKCKDSKDLGGDPVSWEIFKKAFLYRFFPREKREANVEEFIDLHQGGLCVKEYSLKFVKLSIYDSSLVSNARDKMVCYVMGVYEVLEEECHTTMLHDNTDLSMLMVHSQKVEKSRLRKTKWEAKKAISFESGSSLSRLHINDSRKLKKWFLNKVP